MRHWLYHLKAASLSVTAQVRKCELVAKYLDHAYNISTNLFLLGKEFMESNVDIERYFVGSECLGCLRTWATNENGQTTI